MLDLDPLPGPHILLSLISIISNSRITQRSIETSHRLKYHQISLLSALSCLRNSGTQRNRRFIFRTIFPSIARASNSNDFIASVMTILMMLRAQCLVKLFTHAS